MTKTQKVKSTPAVDFSNTEIAFSHQTNKELKRAAFIFRLLNSPAIVRVSNALALWATKWRIPLSERIIKETVFKQFCGGTTLLECQPVIDHLHKFHALTVLDYGVEARTSEEELENTVQVTLRAIEFAASNSSVPVVSLKVTGVADNDLLEKWQSDEDLTTAEETAFEKLMARVDSLCRHAHEHGVGIFIDAEESWMQATIDHIVYTMMERYNSEKCVVYATYQLYRKGVLQQLRDDFANAQAKGYILGAKLVRGAYMNKERDRAARMGYPDPIHATKADTDSDYNAAIHFCVENYERLASCNASHNQDSNRLQAELIAAMDLPRSHPHLNFCQLYGMSDYITFNLSENGYNVAKYLPYGAVRDVMPYLIRRAKENTSVTGDMSRELALIVTEMKRRGLK